MCPVRYMKNVPFKIFFILITVSFLSAGSYFIRLSETGMQQRGQFLSGQFGSISGIAAKSGAASFKALSRSAHFRKWLTLQADSGWIAELKKEGIIEYSEPVGRFKINGSPRDSLFKRQWYFDKLKVLKAWEKTRGDSSIVIGVIDTGVDYTHPDLQGSLWQNAAEKNGVAGIDDDGNGYVDDIIGWDFTDAPRFADGGDYQDEDNDPMDEFGNGHGTQVAGLIAAQVNEIGIAGIAPAVRVMVLRAGTASGYLEEDDVARAILYAVDNGARILNMSFGDEALSQLLRDVIHFAHEQGLVLVASAGNSGSDKLLYPAGLTETISVGATTVHDYLAGFSTYGATLDLTAPGDSIISTAIGGGYNVVNGTSFSAPITAAVSGLILSLHPSFKPEQVRNILKTSADDILYSGWDFYTGAGRLNAEKALNVQENGILEMQTPPLNFSTAADTLWISGTALHPDIRRIELSVGSGQNPTKWTLISSRERQQVYRDTLGFVLLKELPDTSLQLKLKMELINGRADELHRQVEIDRTAPKISAVQVIPMFDGAGRSCLITFTSDDLCRATVHLRPCGSGGFSDEISFPYVSTHQVIKLPAGAYSGCFEFYLKAENNSGLSTVDNNTGAFYSFNLDFESDWNEFSRLPWELPAGYLLDKSTDLNGNGKPEVLLSRYDEASLFGPLEIYEFSDGQFDLRLRTAFTAIPRDAGDVDGDGLGDMLLGYGQRSFLFESKSAAAFPTEPVWMDTVNFWAAGYSDLDGDGIEEIIGRRDSLYLVLETTGDNRFEQIGALKNTSFGANQYGTPKIQENDFTGDGTDELIFGDYDGDVLIYTKSAEGVFTLLDTVQATQQDATGLIAAAGSHLFVASHSANEAYYEHEADTRYWSIDHFVFSRNTNVFVRKETLHFSGYKNQKDFDSGLKLSKISGAFYLFAGLYPNLYVFRIDEDAMRLVWFRNDGRTNAILTADLNRDGREEFYYNNGTKIIGFSSGEATRPAFPFVFNASSVDSNRIFIKWSAVQGAQGYQIFRGTHRDSLSLRATVSTESFMDTGLSKETLYYYAVATLDSSFTVPHSLLSVFDSARTSRPPHLLRVLAINNRQLQLGFDEEISLSGEQPALIRLTHLQQNAESAVIMSDRHHLLCSFSGPFANGQTDTVHVANVFDVSGVPVDKHYDSAFFSFLSEMEKPYLQKTVIESRTKIRLYFSQTMDGASLKESRNYRLSPSGMVEKVTLLDSAHTAVQLQLSANSLVGALGQPAYLELQNLISSTGILLKETGKINLFREQQGLSQVLIYPQPVRPGQRALLFAKLPQYVEISVFNINGGCIWHFKDQTLFGGVEWNLKDTSGRRVSSGIYLYEIKNKSKHTLGKIVVVR